MARPRHPKAEIENAIQVAEACGWRVKLSNGHAWGRLLCPLRAREGCIISVWSTPRSAGNHARGILKAVERCGHSHEE
jgi:hypothetical protein